MIDLRPEKILLKDCSNRVSKMKQVKETVAFILYFTVRIIVGLIALPFVLIYYIFEAFGRAFNKFIEITFQVD